MIVEYVTITGADDKVKPEDLMELSRIYPFLEWGVLFYEKKMGSPRYPTERWIMDLIDAAMELPEAPALSLHICGDSVDRFLRGPFAEPKFYNLMELFGRVQLNLDFRARGIKADMVKPFIQSCKANVITQYNESNKWAWESFKDLRNHRVLFDSSKGNGLIPDVWPEPISSVKCGYAGGLTPDNLESNLDKIKMVAAHSVIWVDMESGVRTDNKFDLKKVNRVATIANNFING